jgi:integrase
VTTFRQQAEWWLGEIRAGRVVSRKRRTQIKPATIAGYESAVKWLNSFVGDTHLSEIKNDVAKQLMLQMRASLSDKTTVNYFQVVRSVVASAVSNEGEQLFPRNWNFQFIGLPIVDERKQTRPTLSVNEVEHIIQRGKNRYRILFALLAGTGLRIGEALGLRIGEHISDDCSTIKVRQSVWGSSVQSPKTQNAVREIDLPSSLASFLKTYIGDRKDGFLFQTASGKPLTQRNVSRDGLSKIRRDLKLDQNGKSFHAFRRFRSAHLRKSRVPWDLEKFWLGHANKSIGDRYAEQLKEDVEWRKRVAEETGLGFKLPTESSVGLLGLPNDKKLVETKAA